MFAPGNTSPLMRVPATGGNAVAVTALGPGQSNHRHPNLLPDGRHVLFFATGSPDTAGIYLGALDGTAPTRLTPAEGAGVFLSAAPGSADARRDDRARSAEPRRASEGGWLLG